ncbi:MAG: DUF748 domain-containing protein [Fluviicola sp.]
MAKDKNNKEGDDKSKKKSKLKKRLIIFGSIFLVILGFRIWLPYYIKNELVSAINAEEGYYCELEDVDLELYRGAIILENLRVYITDNNVSEPFVILPKTDIACEWSSIFSEVLVGKVVVERPHLYFSDGEKDENEQIGGTSWTEPIIDFIPFEINHFEIIDGVAEFENKDSRRKIDVHMRDIDLIATNLRNTTHDLDSLPSNVRFTSTLFETGRLDVDGELNILKDVPDMDLDIKIDGVDLKQLNPVWEQYASLDFESGSFALASEFVMRQSEVDGYVKPILDNVSIFSLREEGTFKNKSWQAFAGFLFEITENQKLDRTASKVPISGNYQSPDIDAVVSILNIFRNAIVQAYGLELDNSVSFGGVKADTHQKSFGKKVKEAFTK